jgi:hypothetical protein
MSKNLFSWFSHAAALALFLCGPFAASAQRIIVPRSDWTTPFTLSVNTNKNNSAYGQIAVVVGGVTYPINSAFSYPRHRRGNGTDSRRRRVRNPPGRSACRR